MIKIILLIPFLLITTLPVHGDFHQEMVQFMPGTANFDDNWDITKIQGFKDLELEWSSEKPDGLIQRFVFNDAVDKTQMINTVSVYDFSTVQTSSNIFDEYVSTLIKNDYPAAPLDKSLQENCFATMTNEGTADEKTSVTCHNSKYVIISTSEQTGQVFHNGKQLTTLIASNGFTSLIYENIENSKPSLKTESSKIPNWIKNNAGWWADGITSDKTFVNAIQFLIDEGIIIVPTTSELSQDQSANEIPQWIKNNAKWWADGTISDDDFIRGLQFLIEQGIIQL